MELVAFSQERVLFKTKPMVIPGLGARNVNTALPRVLVAIWNVHTERSILLQVISGALVQYMLTGVGKSLILESVFGPHEGSLLSSVEPLNRVGEKSQNIDAIAA